MGGLPAEECGGASIGLNPTMRSSAYATASRSVFPTLNDGTFEAAVVIVSPVRGKRREPPARTVCEPGVAPGVKALTGLDVRSSSTVFTVNADTDVEDATSGDVQGAL